MNALSSSRKVRLNPFLFPSETDLRFVLLIVILLAESLFTYSYLQSAIFVDKQSAQMIECAESTGFLNGLQDFNLQMFSLSGLAQNEEWTDNADKVNRAYQECMREWDLSRASWGIGGCILLALVTLGIYLFLPSQKIKQNNYMPIPAEDAGDMLDYLKSICAEIGIAPPPIFLWNPLDQTISGLAFGSMGKYYVAITGGMVTRFYADREVFRSVILHELGHLRNKDVDKTYLTVAAWRAFVFVVLIPQFFAVFIGPLRELFGGLDNIGLFFKSAMYAMVFAVDAIAFFILVYLTRNGLLRTRELYADARASAWGVLVDSYTRTLQSLAGATPKFPEFLRNHPDLQKRIGLLTDTTPLFMIGLLDAFMIGVAAMVGTDEFRTLLVLLLPFFQYEQIVSGLLTGLLYSAILIGVLGTAVWRHTFFIKMTGQPQSRLVWWKIGMGLGLGSAFGASISFANAVNSLYGLWYMILVFVFNIFLGIFFGISFSLFLTWMSESADVWLTVASTPDRMRKFHWFLSALSAITLTCWLGWVFTAWSPGNAPLTLLGLVAGLPLAVMNPFTIFFFMLLWLCPLMAYFWSKHPVEFDRSWAFLDVPAQTTKFIARQFAFGKVILVGGIIGVLYCACELFSLVLLRFVVADATRATDQYKVIFFDVNVLVVVLAQVLIATIVALWVKQLKFSHGLMAAFAGGCIMALGFSVNNLLFGSGWISIVFPWTLNGGAILALPILLLITAVSSQR